MANGFIGATQGDLVLTPGQLYVLAQKAGWNRAQAVIAMAIAMAESGGKKNAINKKNTNGTEDYGLWQVNSVHGYDKNRLLNDGEYNAAAAYAIYKKQGWAAWSVFKSGAYKSNLDVLDESAKRAAEREYGTGKISDTILNTSSDVTNAVSDATDAVTGQFDSVGDFLNTLGKKSTWMSVGQVAIGGVLVTVAVLIFAAEFVKKVPTPVKAVIK